jgi:cytochrome c
MVLHDMMLGPILLALLQQQPAPSPILPVRPRDPFVFRCVLDRHPRMITAALGDDLWVAWDAQTCALYKAWKGDVKFDGPVYTTVHGPQPTTEGTDYTNAVEGAVWSATKNGQPIGCRMRYGGYRIVAGTLTLQWHALLEDGTDVVVDEMPELVRPKELFSAEQLDDAVLGEGNQPGLRRIFEAHGLPEGTQLAVSMRTDNTVCKLGAFERERFDDVKDARGVILSTRIFSSLPISHDQPQTGCILFFRPVTALVGIQPANEAK